MQKPLSLQFPVQASPLFENLLAASFLAIGLFPADIQCEHLVFRVLLTSDDQKSDMPFRVGAMAINCKGDTVGGLQHSASSLDGTAQARGDSCPLPLSIGAMSFVRESTVS